MKAIILEGTLDEVSQAIQRLGQASASVSVVPVTAAAQVSEVTAHPELPPGSPPPITVELARAVLNRIPLAAEQKIVLKALYHAHPSWVTAPDLMAKVKYTRPQFTGLMGAFGRRLTHTPGYINGTTFFDQVWDNAAGINRYTLPETVREAMRLEKLV